MTIGKTSAEPLPIAFILAAGGSRRMGTSKALLRLEGMSLLEQHVAALTPFSASVVVVLGANDDQLRVHLPPQVIAVFNPHWATTEPADSLRMALQVVPTSRMAWLVPVDTPPATADTLSRLLDQGAPALPVDSQDRPGHPALLGDTELAVLRDHAPPGGVRTLLGSAWEVRVDDPLVAMNLNTPQDWETFVRMRRSG